MRRAVATGDGVQPGSRSPSIRDAAYPARARVWHARGELNDDVGHGGSPAKGGWRLSTLMRNPASTGHIRSCSKCRSSSDAQRQPCCRNQRSDCEPKDAKCGDERECGEQCPEWNRDDQHDALLRAGVKLGRLTEVGVGSFQWIGEPASAQVQAARHRARIGRENGARWIIVASLAIVWGSDAAAGALPGGLPDAGASGSPVAG